MSRHGRRALWGLVGAAAIAAVAILALRPTAPPPTVGMVRTTEVKIAPEISGRIFALPVNAGEHVQAGATIAQHESLELAASVEEARAAVANALANRAHVYAGVRQEEVNIVGRELEKASADLTLAQQTYGRTSTVAQAGYTSQQKLDEAQASLAVAQANVASLESQLAEAQHGPTAEDRAIADAEVTAAEASLTVLQRKLDKLQLRAPVDGVVQTVVAELEEATVPGRTVLTLTVTEVPWFSFNIREDALGGMDIGTMLTLTPSGGDKGIPAKVSEMRRLGNFATWRAARAVGDHDLNMFAVRADPTGPVAGLEPGMTVWISTKP